jgi:DNA-binding IclR family transcriptional regulator
MFPVLAMPAPPTATGRIDLLLRRIQSEYSEMPGLQLTVGQAARLLGIDRALCESLFDHLAGAGFLRRRERGHYVLAVER